jgi:beta-glucosidase
MFQDTPLYPFGFGLSYTNFTYANLVLNQTTVGKNGAIKVSLNVTNTGPVSGDEVVQVYVRKTGVADPSRPKLQLKGFQRVGVPAGTTVPVTIPVAMESIATWSITAGDYVVVPGTYEVLAAASASDIRLIGSFTISG